MDGLAKWSWCEQNKKEASWSDWTYTIVILSRSVRPYNASIRKWFGVTKVKWNRLSPSTGRPSENWAYGWTAELCEIHSSLNGSYGFAWITFGRISTLAITSRKKWMGSSNIWGAGPKFTFDRTSTFEIRISNLATDRKDSSKNLFCKKPVKKFYSHNESTEETTPFSVVFSN